MVREQGMTLLEVLIAMMILSVGLIGTIPFMTTAMSGNTAARQTAEATLLIQEKFEEFRRVTAYTTNPSLTLASLLDTNGNTDLDAPGNLSTYGSCVPSSSTADQPSPLGYEVISRPELRGCYTRLWNIADGTPDQNMKTVKVIVAWWEGGRVHGINATTIIAAKDRRFY